jgi:nicotinamidase-related amidase
VGQGLLVRDPALLELRRTEHTARAAADYGYRVSVVSDATLSINGEWQHAALNFGPTNIVTVSETAAVSKELDARPH